MGTSTGHAWHWTQRKNAEVSVDGDIAKNFRNEGGSELDPGILATTPIPNAARFLTREFIQNSIDASRDPYFMADNDDQTVEIVFRFTELSGPERSAFVDACGLEELATRSNLLKDGAAPKESFTCINTLRDDLPLRLLYVEEYGTSGMYGPFDDNKGKSKMSLAMLSVNDTDKPSTAGGAYGQGKSVNAAASRIRVNVAYSCFVPHSSEPEVSRRLLGVAYWPGHEDNSDPSSVRRFTGWGRLGELRQDGLNQTVLPWTNKSADERAQALGFTLRAPQDRREMGTTMLILDPDVEPIDVKRAVERYWWPAISDGKLLVKVIDWSGSEMVARPKLDPLLRAFDETYRAIRVPSNHDASKLHLVESARLQKLGIKSGDIALVPLVGTEDDTESDRRSSLVAHIRGLGMVVKYRSIAVGPVYVQGVFVANADNRVETMLNKSENKTHYDWLDTPDVPNPDEKEAIRLLVNNIKTSVYNEVRKFSRRLTPDEEAPPTRLKIPSLLQSLLTNSDDPPPPPPPGSRGFSINREIRQKKAIGDSQIQVSGIVKVTRTSPELSSCRVTIRYFLPENHRRGDPIELTVLAPDDFVQDPNDRHTFGGPCGNDPLVFKWTTPPYDSTWLGDLDVIVR